MPNLVDTREALESLITTGWGETTPIKYESVNFDDKGKDAFISIMLINYTSKNVCIGSADTKRIRHEGVLAVKINTKQNIGSVPAYTYAQQVKDILENIVQPNLFTLAAQTRKNKVVNDGWYCLIVDVPYVSDEE